MTGPTTQENAEFIRTTDNSSTLIAYCLKNIKGFSYQNVISAMHRLAVLTRASRKHLKPRRTQLKVVGHTGLKDSARAAIESETFWLEKALEALLRRGILQVRRMNGFAVVRFLWSLATLRHLPEQNDLLLLLDHAQSTIPELNPVSLGLLYWSCAVLEVPLEGELRYKLDDGTMKNLPLLTPQCISMILWSYSKQRKALDTELYQELCKQAIRLMEQFKQEEFNMLLLALKQLRYPLSREMKGAITEHIKLLLPSMHQGTFVSVLDNLVRSKESWGEELPAILSEYVYKNESVINVDSLVNILWNFSQWQVKPDDQLIEVISLKLARKPLWSTPRCDTYFVRLLAAFSNLNIHPPPVLQRTLSQLSPVMIPRFDGWKVSAYLLAHFKLQLKIDEQDIVLIMAQVRNITKGMEANEIGSVLTAMSKLELRPPEDVHDKMMKRLAEGINYLDVKYLHDILRSHAMLGLTVTEKILECLTLRAQNLASTFSSFELSFLLWSLQVLMLQPPAYVIEGFINRSKEIAPRLDEEQVEMIREVLETWGRPGEIEAILSARTSMLPERENELESEEEETAYDHQDYDASR